MRLWRPERVQVSWDWKWAAVGAFLALRGSKILYLLPLPFLVVEIRLDGWFANKYGGSWRQRKEPARLEGEELGRAQKFIDWQLADLWAEGVVADLDRLNLVQLRRIRGAAARAIREYKKAREGEQ